MSLGTAVRTCLAKYVDFTGRARRSEFWWFCLFCAIVSIVAAVLDSALNLTYGPSGDETGVLSTVVTLALVLPSLAVGARRLHDVDKSGWWQLLALIPFIGTIILIVAWAQDSQRMTNRFGPSPKYPDAAALPGYGMPQPYGQPPF